MLYLSGVVRADLPAMLTPRPKCALAVRSMGPLSRFQSMKVRPSTTMSTRAMTLIAAISNGDRTLTAVRLMLLVQRRGTSIVVTGGWR